MQMKLLKLSHKTHTHINVVFDYMSECVVSLVDALRKCGT